MADFDNLPSGPFDAILADPPWEYRNARGLQGLAADQYETLSIEVLKRLPVARLAAERCVLLMWCTWPKLPQGIELMRAWGFEHKTGLPWVKTYGEGKPVCGVGWWVRGASEPLLIGTRGSPGVPPKSDRVVGLIGELILTTPRGRHSQKPVEVHSFAERLTAHIGDRRLELFARDFRTGWTCWGRDLEAFL